MHQLAFLPILAPRPSLLRRRDILLLALLRPARQEVDDGFAVLPEINAVTEVE